MVSATSGFVRVIGNHAYRRYVNKSVSVPTNNSVVVSYKEHTPSRTYVKLDRYFIRYGPSETPTTERERIWSRWTDAESDVAHLFQAIRFSVNGLIKGCKKGTCFKLFFSFFPDSEGPLKSPQGLWNCSVKHYASFQHHLACNLKTECEDGQDETGDCPYSSSQCNGLIALCDSCYQLVVSLEGFVSENRDAIERANEYCYLVHGQQRVPMCVHELHDKVTNYKFHSGWLNMLWVGLYFQDSSLPKMYRNAVVDNNRTIMHHLWENQPHSMSTTKVLKKCLITGFEIKLRVRPIPCFLPQTELTAGTVCVRRNNRTRTKYHYSKEVPVRNTTFTLSSGRQDLIQCPDGHMTHSFFLCGSDRYKMCDQQPTTLCTFSGGSSLTDEFKLSEHHFDSTATFTCDDDSARVSYTLVCDFITDCPDNSDESFCKRLPCPRMFTCNNGQCLPFEKTCDVTLNCMDDSDEENCSILAIHALSTQVPCPSPALVRFNGIAQFMSTPMMSNDTCPDTHYRCPGVYNDCLPVYTRCNGPYDCVDHQDEEGCEEMKCPGLFRCRRSTICLHSDHVCDGWPHCPMYDDELTCNITCPISCLCQGHTFLCPRPFSAALFLQLRYLDATRSNLTLQDVGNNALLIGLVLARCSLTLVPKTQLKNVRFLDLSGNQLQYVNLTSVLGLESLRTLSLSSNPLSSLYADLSADQHTGLTVLNLAHTRLTVLDTTVLSLFPRINKLNLTATSIHTISPEGFQFMPQLKELHMDDSPIQTFPPDLFEGLRGVRFIATQNYKFCCTEILSHNRHSVVCLAPKDEISSCKDLLQSWVYRVFLWLVACLSVTGNIFCCCARLFVKGMTSSSGFSVFVTNLTVADFLMGVYIAVIGVADERFRGRYLHNDDTWKNSATCQAAGFLSLLSSEVSVLVIWFITLDRFVVLRFPFSSIRFNKASAAMACLLNWSVGWILALLPLLPMASHWRFYSQTGICVPLPVTRKDFKGRFYSIGVLIIFNFIIFLFISTGQAFIYWSVQGNILKTNSTRVSQDMTIARRLITIAVTDFLCWFPIGLCGMLALGGIPIPGEVNVALAVFVLPLNSAINPFMYTLNTVAEKNRKTNEGKLLKWLESHPELIGDE